MAAAKYDVVYTDIRMPGMDGLELAEQVKAQHPWTPVVIVTGYGTTANEARAKAAGVSAFLHKPLSPDMIEDSATDALLQPAPVKVATAEARTVHAAQPVTVAETGGLQRIGLLLAAPFIGLAYIVLLPFFGLAFLGAMAIKGLATLPVAKAPLTFVKNVGLFLAAPFVGLAYVVMFPFVGAAMLARFGYKAFTKKGAAEK
jgi:CheY-like chemotaxis protein